MTDSDIDAIGLFFNNFSCFLVNVPIVCKLVMLIVLHNLENKNEAN